MKPQIGLQLWSIQDVCKQDLHQALKHVKDSGYDGVEFAGYYDHSAEEIKDMLDEFGLAVAASHIPYETLHEKFEETIAFEQTIGNTRIVVPYAMFPTLGEWRSFMEEMEAMREKLTRNGFEFFYHNHAHEFTEIPDVNILDEMIKRVPGLKLEADLYWIAYSGMDVLPWISERHERIGLFHLKDMREWPKESTEIGAGFLPIKQYVEAAKEFDLPWLIVEQEAFQAHQPLEAVAIDYTNLAAIVEEVYK